MGQVSEVFWTQNDTSGGSSETGTNVDAANPTRAPDTSAAIAITPVGKWPKASRSEAGLNSVLFIFGKLHANVKPGSSTVE